METYERFSVLIQVFLGEDNCSDILEYYQTGFLQDDGSRPQLDNDERYFVLCYSSILLKDLYNAERWSSLYRKACGMKLSNYQECLSLFLQVHIEILNFNFIRALISAHKGLDLCCGNHNLEPMFKFLSGWCSRFVGMDSVANSRFKDALIEYGDAQDIFGKFVYDSLRMSIEFVDKEDSSILARYYYNEYRKICGLLSWDNIFADPPDYYSSLLGERCAIYLFEQTVTSIKSDKNTEIPLSLSGNQRIYCEILSGRMISLKDLSADSYVFASKHIADAYESEARAVAMYGISTSGLDAVFDSFECYLYTPFCQLDFSGLGHIINGLIHFNNDTIDAIVAHSGDNGLVDFVRKTNLGEDQLCFDGLPEKYLNNLKTIIENVDIVTAEQKLDILYDIYSFTRFTENMSQSIEESQYISREIAPALGRAIGFQVMEPGKTNSPTFYQRTLPYDSCAYPGFDIRRSLFDDIVLRTRFSVLLPVGIEVLAGYLDSMGESDSYSKLRQVECEQLERNIEYYGDSVICKEGRIWQLASGSYLYLFDISGEYNVNFYDGYYVWADSNQKVDSPISEVISYKEKNGINDDIKWFFLFLAGAKIRNNQVLKKLQGGYITFCSLPLFLSKCLCSDSKEGGGLAYIDFSAPGVNIEDYIQDVSNQQYWDLEVFLQYVKQSYETKITDYYECLKPDDDIHIKSFGLVNYVVEKVLKVSEFSNAVLRVHYPEARFRFDISFLRQDKKVIVESLRLWDDEVWKKDDDSSQRISLSIDSNAFFPLSSINKADYAEVEGYFKGWRSEELRFSRAGSKMKVLAQKAAKAAIMSRNMSHNLGSHVMAYLKQHLNSMSAMLRNNVFDQLFENYDSFEALRNNPKEWPVPESARNLPMPFLVGLGRFLSYLQERQDFIASIATDYIPSSNRLNFKDMIYDELNLDKRSLRHLDRMGEIPDNILLGNIARSEGLFREHCRIKVVDVDGRKTKIWEKQNGHDIVLKFRNFNGNPPEESCGQPSLSENDLNDMRRYDFSIPGGVTGRHAFFSIVENIIRNSAKHGNRAGADSLELTMDIFDVDTFQKAPNNDQIDGELSLRDVFTHFYEDANDSGNLYYITITDNFKTDKNQLYRIRMNMVDELVDINTYAFREGAKGFKEMRFCACWLRDITGMNNYFAIPKRLEGNLEVYDFKPDVEWNYNNGAYPAPILYARISNDHLQYIFAVKKPHSVLILLRNLPKSSDQWNENYKLLSESGWGIRSVSNYLEFPRGRDYDFILADDDDPDFEEVICNSGRRLLKKSAIRGASELMNTLINSETIITREQVDEVERNIWEAFSGYEKGEVIHVEDEKARRNHSDERKKMGKYVSFDYSGDSRFEYVCHFETANNFLQRFRLYERRKMFPDFVEGISGSNSTDRMLRNDSLDDRWFNMHLHSAKQRIAIFDERLSFKMFGKERPQTEVWSVEGYTGVLYALKGIDVFNIAKITEDESVIYGLNFTDGLAGTCARMRGKPDGFSSRCSVVAVLSKKQIGGKVELVINFRQKCLSGHFDLLSIHQGLLDKLYEFLEIKDDWVAKERATRKIYESFARNGSENVIDLKDGHFFLPGMTIHSGRSKPAEMDMPQRLPFVQYASLENAFFDCKYSLCELLESAYHE